MSFVSTVFTNTKNLLLFPFLLLLYAKLCCIPFLISVVVSYYDLIASTLFVGVGFIFKEGRMCKADIDRCKKCHRKSKHKCISLTVICLFIHTLHNCKNGMLTNL